MKEGGKLKNSKWIVKHATLEDLDRWFEFVETVQSDFCNLNLMNDEKFRSGMKKNIQRGTAIYIEDTSLELNPIIGALSYSLNQNHISWLAVNSEYRRRKTASTLMEYSYRKLSDTKEIRIKTFLYDDEYGIAARAFYKNHGFILREVLMKEEGYPHPVQIFIKTTDGFSG
jgi:ribosomal protein S18 acetylase RimI-like enzyme